MKKVGIIGGSGYIGSYNTKKFLEEGYQVKVSVTDLSKKEKYKHLRSLPNAENLEIVELNVKNIAQLEQFVKGCAIIVNGGTPFQLNFEDPKGKASIVYKNDLAKNELGINFKPASVPLYQYG